MIQFTNSFVNKTYDILDKKKAIDNYVSYMLDRTSQMFEYDGLPDTIPGYILETYLQVFGGVAICKMNGELWAIFGNPGGALDPYYRPTIFVAANPALGESRTFRIENHLKPFDAATWSSYEPCIYIRSDTQSLGLLPLFNRYATELAENDISIRSAQINSRQLALISASTDAEKESADKYIADVEAGKLSSVAENPFLTGIRVQNVSTISSNSIIQLIELQQYLKASWFNEIGLNANFNMKREYLSTEEIQASTDLLIPLSDDMLMCREQGIKAVNELFGTNISVKKNSAWENKDREIKVAQEQAERDAGITIDEPITGPIDEEIKKDGEPNE